MTNIELQDDEVLERTESGEVRVVKKRSRRIDVDWEGDRLILPNGMDYDEAIRSLRKRRDEDNQTVEFSETVRAFPADGAVAFQKALRQKYGWTSLQPRRSFWGDEPPRMVPVHIAFDEAIQVPWGEIQVPNIKGSLHTSYELVDGMPHFKLVAQIRRADKAAFEEIVQLTKTYVQEESIYKAQAIRLSFRDEDGDSVGYDPEFSPKFMDLKSFDPTELVLPADAGNAVQINLWNPIQHTEFCRANHIPLKRGVLLEGGYGTGKTLTAFQTAQLCVNNGWTFVLLDDVRDIHQALEFARMYEPCVIFAEDVDKAAKNGQRTDETNRIFNTIDGIEAKGRDIMTVLTTNLVGDIHPGFIRPGRIDAVITVGPPDDQAIVRLVRRYAQDSQGRPVLDELLNDEQIVAAMAPVKGANAAFIREVVERSKLAAISHADGAIVVSESDLATAANTMKMHLDLVNGTPDEDGNVMDTALEAMSSKFAESFVETLASPSAMNRVMTAAERKIKSRR